MTTATDEKPAAKVVSSAEWLAARKQLLAKEKEFTRLRDELSRQRREMPWEKVEKQYVFDGRKERNAGGFVRRAQPADHLSLHVRSGWKEGCPSCSFLADSFDGSGIDLAQRDTTMLAVSRATLPEIDAFKKRMGWKFKWVSSNGTRLQLRLPGITGNGEQPGGSVYYNYQLTQFPSDERPGLSVFVKNDGEVFHTYSTYARGLDILLNAYNMLDTHGKGARRSGR